MTEKGSTTGGSERITVNLTPRGARALNEAAELTGHNKTDVINRALQVYAYLEDVLSNGGQVLTKTADDSETTTVHFF